MKSPSPLPEPDAYGTYWFGKPPSCPAIFRGGGPHYVDNAKNVLKPRWFASDKDGTLFDGGNLRYFDSPLEALKAMKL